MKIVAASSSLAALLLPSLAAAEPLSFGGGVSVTSNYLSDGLSETDNGPAIQPYFEVTRNGFYGGVWATNLNDDAGNRAELDLYGGYRGETASGLSYDLGYTQYLYDNTHDFSSELSAVLGVPVTEQLTLTGEVDFDFGENTFGELVGAEYALSDVWLLHADAGRADPDSSAYWGAGVTYGLSDRVSLDLQYQDTATTSGLVALTLTYAFADGER